MKNIIRDGILKIAQAKYTQDQVNYRDAEDGNRCCGACEHYDEEDASAGACKLVDGEIEAFKVCDKFDTKKGNVMDTDRGHGNVIDSQDDDV